MLEQSDDGEIDGDIHIYCYREAGSFTVAYQEEEHEC